MSHWKPLAPQHLACEYPNFGSPISRADYNAQRNGTGVGKDNVQTTSSTIQTSSAKEKSMASVLPVMRSASLVSVGTLVGQLIAFAGSLVLVRIFSPEQMGMFTTIVAVSSFIAPIASGQLYGAIPLPLQHSSAVTIYKLAITCAAVFGGIVLIVLFGLSFATGDFSAQDSVWLWGLPALIISLVVYSGMNGLAVRFEQYFGLALRGVLYPLVMTGTQILLGLVHFGAAGLVLGMVFGHCVTALSVWLPVRRTIASDQELGNTWKQLLRDYRHFPLVLGPAGAINGLAMQLPQIGVTILFGLAVGGQFGMMMKILAVPVALIGQSVGFVYAGQIAKSRRAGEKDVRLLFDRMSLLLGGVAVVFVLLSFFLAEPVFSWLLGEEWRMSGQLAAIFTLAPAMQLVASPLSQTLIVSERTFQQLTIDGIRAGSLAMAFILLFLLQIEVFTSVFVISVVSMTGYLLLWIINRRAARDIKPNVEEPEQKFTS